MDEEFILVRIKTIDQGGMEKYDKTRELRKDFFKFSKKSFD